MGMKKEISWDLKAFLTTNKQYDDKLDSLGKTLKIFQTKYPSKFGWINDEWKSLPEVKKALKDFKYFSDLSKKFNSLPKSKDAIKEMGKMNIMERMALRKDINKGGFIAPSTIGKKNK